MSQQRVLTIESGERAELALTLERGEPRPGRIVVRTSREDVFVIVDGLSRGLAPITLEHVRPGRHVVRLAAEGAAPHETQCVIAYGETCTIEGELAPAAVSLRVTASVDGEPVPGAELVVDGDDAGALPWEGELSPGQHTLVARAEGLEPASRTLEVTPALADSVVVLSLAPLAPAEPLEPEPEPAPEPAPADPEPTARAFVPRGGADALANGSGAASFSVGWPYLIGAEVAVGLPGPLDLGVGMRTFGRLTELGVRARAGSRVLDFLALGAVVRLAAGIGPDDINSFALAIDGRITAFPIPTLGISAWLGLDVSTDAYPYRETDGSALLVNVGRQNLARGRVGGALEWLFTPEWSAELRVEGIFASSGGTRRIYGDVLELGGPDTQLYVQLAAAYQW